MSIRAVRVARRRPYLYIGFSRSEHVAYVGQTLDRRGVLGRWTDHLSGGDEASSFRRRLAEVDESAFERLDDLTVVAWDLGDGTGFMSIETSHREAVEYLV